jgi:hypothetical protein
MRRRANLDRMAAGVAGERRLKLTPRASFDAETAFENVERP